MKRQSKADSNRCQKKANPLRLRKKYGGQPVLLSIISCPQCGYRAEETMPTNACLFFYDCPACGEKLKPKLGDCCIFCSYGSVPCPPAQTGSTTFFLTFSGKATRT